MVDLSSLKVLITEDDIKKRIDVLAKQIYEEYKNEDITFICTLKGAVFFAVELAKKIPTNVNFEFIKVSSYEGENSTGVVSMKMDLQEDIKGKNVLIIEDIIDTGKTLTYLKEYLLKKEPKTLKVCALLDKKDRRICPMEADYLGFDIPDKFVVGYGLDVDQKYRNLPYIGYFDK